MKILAKKESFLYVWLCKVYDYKYAYAETYECEEEKRLSIHPQNPP